MSQPDPEQLARKAAAEIIDRVAATYPESQGQVLGELVRRLMEFGLYRFAPDDGSGFAASLNEQLSQLAAGYDAGVVWQLVRVRLPVLEPPGAADPARIAVD